MRGWRARIHRARSGPDLPGWTHARSYVGLSPANFVHRARLRVLGDILRGLALPPSGRLVDLGCSDGFVLWRLQEEGVLPTGWCAAGYEVDRRLLRAARRRDLANVTFEWIDLNDVAARVPAGDVVISLETLEHVGDYRSALWVLHRSVRVGGWIVVSMPNEVGWVGLVKLVGRPLLRRHPYDGFFSGPAGAIRYAATVVHGGDLERFRQPPRAGWAPHLGFDHRSVVRHVRATFVDVGRWQLVGQRRSALGANRFLVARRSR